MSNRKALLIIDMQKGSFTPLTPRYDTSGVVKRINLVADAFRFNSLPVFYIQHDGTASGEFVPNTSEWELLDELVVREGDIFVDKYANNIFYNSALQAKLIQHSVKELIISGCATDFCVESTIQAALTMDYDITVIENAHTTGERPHLTALQVIEHYNWVWKNMIPTKGVLKVKPHTDILNALSEKQN